MRKQRKQNNRPMRPRFVLAFEGAVTEKEYFNTVKKLLGKEVNIKLEYALPSKKHRSAPKQIIDCINRHLKSKDNKLQEGDSAWVIADFDNRADSELLCLFEWQKIDKQRHFLAISNPRFELWIRLHNTDKPKNIDLKASLEKLDKNKRLKGREIDLPKIRKAIERAKEADVSHCPQNKCPAEGVTTVYHLLKKLLDASLQTP